MEYKRIISVLLLLILIVSAFISDSPGLPIILIILIGVIGVIWSYIESRKPDFAPKKPETIKSWVISFIIYLVVSLIVWYLRKLNIW